MKLETKVQAPALRRGPERIHLLRRCRRKPSRYRSLTAFSIDAENFSAEIDFYPSYELVKERPVYGFRKPVSLSFHLPAVVASPSSPSGGLVGLGGLEPPTSRLSGARSSQLSYRPSGFPAPASFKEPSTLRSASQNQTANPRTVAETLTWSTLSPPKWLVHPVAPKHSPCTRSP